ncbi:MAG: aspartate/glutamate racemase family protein [Rhizobiaceae bacterium]|nr:aspartate/glutamate racemase family protein [Rhizobiaceae bacterium]
MNAVLEPDLAWVSPPELSFHFSRVPLAETTPDGLREMNKSVEGAAALLSHLSPDLLAYACTSGSFVDGEAGLRDQLAIMSKIAGCPAIATSGAIVDAFRHIGATRIALATPYRDEVNLAEKAFFESHALTVSSLVGMGLSGPAIREVPPQRIIELARAADTAESDALFISCTDFRALEVLEDLERELSKPVLSSNQVTLWAILRELGKPTVIPGFGRLLAS